MGNSHLNKSEIYIKPNWQYSTVFWTWGNICLGWKDEKRFEKMILFIYLF